MAAAVQKYVESVLVQPTFETREIPHKRTMSRHPVLRVACGCFLHLLSRKRLAAQTLHQRIGDTKSAGLLKTPCTGLAILLILVLPPAIKLTLFSMLFGHVPI